MTWAVAQLVNCPMCKLMFITTFNLMLFFCFDKSLWQTCVMNRCDVTDSVFIDIKGVTQNFFIFCFLAISTSNLHQIQKVRSVLKSAGSEDFKTDLTFDIWPSRSWENWGQRHQGSFSVFTFLCKDFFPVLAVRISEINLTSCNTFCDIFNTNNPAFNKKY